MDALILMSVYMTMLFCCGREEMVELEQQQKKLEYLFFIFLWQ